MDVELSTRGTAYDVLNITFIYAGRWIGAGWFEPLDGYMNDPKKTPPDWDAQRLPRRHHGIDEGQERTPLRHSLDRRRHHVGRGARGPDPEGRQADARNVRRGERRHEGRPQQGRRSRIHHRQPLRLDLDSLAAGLRRQCLSRSARRSDADARHAGSDRRGGFLRQSAHHLRSERRDLLHLRPGRRGAETGARELFAEQPDVPRADGRRRQQGRVDLRFRALPRRPQRPVSGGVDARLGDSGRLEEQGRRVGIHQVGDVEADDRPHGAREGLHVDHAPLADRAAPTSRRS